MSYDNIIYEKRGQIAYVVLNRPEKLNALSDDLQLEVRSALEDSCLLYTSPSPRDRG